MPPGSASSPRCPRSPGSRCFRSSPGLAERHQALRGGDHRDGALRPRSALPWSAPSISRCRCFWPMPSPAALWTPMVPLTTPMRCAAWRSYGLNYGPLRLWGSAAFVVGALACGLLIDIVAARHLIWIIAAVAGARRARQPRAAAARTVRSRPGAASAARARCCAIRGFLAIIVASALIQGSHAAYYIFASIAWQAGRARRADHCRAVGARRACRDRGVRAVAALHAAAGDAGGDRRAQRGGALADHGAGAADRGAGGGAARAWTDLRADAGRHHGASGAPRAGPCDGARAGLSCGLQRHRHQAAPRSCRAWSTRATGRASIT